MKVQTLKFIFTIALLASLSSCTDSETENIPSYDTLISNASLIDGLGSPARPADIYIKNGLVARITTPDEVNAVVANTIDAGGRVVAPGFIDVHSHGDPLSTPEFENFLAQGVTTITLGQDGDSPELADLGPWIEQVREAGIGVNVAMFVGHGTLRNLAGIGQNPNPGADDLQRMLELLNNALDYTFGLSTGLEYNPGLHAPESELIEMARVVGGRGRVIMSHMRNEDDDQLEKSIDELLSQGQYSRVHISHLKSVYGKGATRAEEILDVLTAARSAGIDITADVYPYNASYAGIALLFPVWSKTAEEFVIAKRDRRNELEEYLVNRIARRNGPGATLLGTDPYTGKTLADLEVELGLPFEEILIDVIGPQGGGGAYFIMDDELQSRLLEDDNITVSSDGSPTGFHPRGHGAFAKIIEEYVVNRNAMTLVDAIRKMTSFSAAVLGLNDRGSVEVGKAADLIVFDPARVKANATYPDPLQLSEGFDIVLVNGEVAFRSGVATPNLSGSVLTP
ncbi:MAG: N-acyl-D-amino acid deacylase [SAR86 cluster bacterium]|uniref:N-acyl-D-amino acid deacylase n=1 Tax=SAR86 cluster bacterium TaxID=2030880 RepID=A0A2A5BAQ5_9GAMM|nr:MAG: N-acyl-D-amino acid deacylase [SAR86 cluster bacterium]